MKFQPQTSIAAHFADLDDPRIDRSKDHLLIAKARVSLSFGFH
jgi:hypothetical protein